MKRTVAIIRRLFLLVRVCNIGYGTSGIKPDAVEGASIDLILINMLKDLTIKFRSFSMTSRRV